MNFFLKLFGTVASTPVKTVKTVGWDFRVTRSYFGQVDDWAGIDPPGNKYDVDVFLDGVVVATTTTLLEKPLSIEEDENGLLGYARGAIISLSDGSKHFVYARNVFTLRK